jgi:hypothetical protein
MRNARTRRGVLRPSKSALRVVTIAVLLAWLGTTHPAPTFAQVVLDCSTNGFCIGGTIDRLLGLPNGTLRFATAAQPWERVVKGSAAVSWAPIEADARAALAALHGVPNDNRLPYAALDELRGFMFMRLLELSQRRALIIGTEGNTDLTMSSVEIEAVEMLHQLVKNRRVSAATKALAEYKRWQSDPCHYTVPAGFGFDEYDPGPGCGLQQQILFGPPSPPTAEQFTSYGSALERKQFYDTLTATKKLALGLSATEEATFTYDPSADMSAAFRDAAEGFNIAAGLALTVAISGAAGIAAVASAGIAGGFAALSGSYSVFGVAAAASGAAVTGVGVALALPAIVIFCIVFSVLRGIQVSDDYAVPTKLQEALTSAHATPDPWTVAATEAGQVELFSNFIDQTLPSYDEQRASSVAPPPAQRQAGDPQFEVVAPDGTTVVQDAIHTLGLNGRQQLTFVSQGWFVTRLAQPNATWGPPRWTLNLRYLKNSADQAEQTAGIQPSTFLLSSRKPGSFEPENARKATEFTAATASGSRKILWKGNRAPVIKATASHQARIAEPVNFNAVVTDPDGDSITRVRWYFDTGNRSPIFQTSLAECSFRPAGRVDTAGQPYLCPMTPVDGTSASITYSVPGTYSVMVMAEDSEGGIASETFSISVDRFVPELTITQLGFLTLPGPGSFPGILEGEPITVSGTLNYPVNPSGNYSDLTKLVVDWGDGQITEKLYPCKDGITFPTVPSDADCIFNFTTREYVERLNGIPNPGSPNLTRGPWAFQLSHTYTYSPERPLLPLADGLPLTANDRQARVKVYAVTVNGAWTPTHRLDFSIRNGTPIAEMRSVCPVVPTGPCSGDFREVGVGQALTLSGRVFDAIEGDHLITVLWGDGTSSELPPDCSEPGCPSFNKWPEAPIVPFQFPKYFYLNHTYPEIGTYPITVIVNDGGPNGKVSIPAAAASIFGVSKLTGAQATSAGIANVYSFTSKLPAGATTPTPMATCEGGTASAVTGSSFTCTFSDVATTTKRKVLLQAVIAGTTFNRSLDVDVRPAQVKIANLDGPTSVLGGMTRTYTYTGTHSQFGTATFAPFCGLGEVTSQVPGSSFTCLFLDTGPTEFAVGVSAIDSFGNTAEAGITVNLAPDTAPPVLTVPAEVKVNSASNDGAIAAFIVTALDNVSGSVRVNCDAESGVLYPIGTTTVRCVAVDWKGLVGSATFPIRVVDVTPPALTLPASQQLNATSPLGAVATFVATAVDVGPLTPTCTPASGSTFAVGVNTVSCSATDAAGNTKSGTFTITVAGAAEQITALQRWIERQSMNATMQKQLVAALKKAGQAAASGDSSTACKQLGTVVSMVTGSQGKLTNAQSNKILNDVARIQAAVGC